MSPRKLTVKDIILMQKQLGVSQQFNELLSEALAEIGDAVGGIDPASAHEEKATEVLHKVKSVLSKLEKEVEEFNKRME